MFKYIFAKVTTYSFEITDIWRTMTSFYTMFTNIRVWVSPSMVYNPFTNLSSGFTNVVFSTFVIYFVKLRFNLCFSFNISNVICFPPAGWFVFSTISTFVFCSFNLSIVFRNIFCDVIPLLRFYIIEKVLYTWVFFFK